MLVSIIIPVYNVAPYISRCLESVARQTYTGSMECILIDDCGQDESVAIARQFINHYQGKIRFLLLTHEYNRGLSAARNTGIVAAQGDYLYFLDSDDWLDPQCIASMVTLAERYSGVEMVQAGAITHGGETKPWLDMSNSPLPDYIQGTESIKPVMLNRQLIPVTAWNRLVNRGFLLRNRLFFQEGIIHEDELWTYQLSKTLSTLAILKKNVYHYGLHESGIMSLGGSMKSESYNEIARLMIDGIDASLTPLTVIYIAHFIQLRSFEIKDEYLRQKFLDCLTLLYPYMGFIKRAEARIWLCLAKIPIRNHYWLYWLLYHWRL